MRKFINIMTIVSAGIASIMILCYFLTSYQFYYVAQMFNYYRPIQISVATTMFFLTMRFWQNEHGDKKIIYSTLSLSISIILLLSISIVE